MFLWQHQNAVVKLETSGELLRYHLGERGMGGLVVGIDKGSKGGGHTLAAEAEAHHLGGVGGGGIEGVRTRAQPRRQGFSCQSPLPSSRTSHASWGPGGREPMGRRLR